MEGRGVSELPYDPEDPPTQPPGGADPVMWRLAYQVYVDHRNSYGVCAAPHCLGRYQPWPCSPARLAMMGMRTAAGTRVPWSTLNRGRAPD